MQGAEYHIYVDVHHVQVEVALALGNHSPHSLPLGARQPLDRLQPHLGSSR